MKLRTKVIVSSITSIVGVIFLGIDLFLIPDKINFPPDHVLFSIGVALYVTGRIFYYR